MTAATITGSGWTLDAVTDPSNYVLVYTGSVAAGDSAPPAVLSFTFTPAAAGTRTFTVAIDSGSGGDTNPANNTDTETVDVNAAAAPAVDLTPILRLLPSTGIQVNTPTPLTLRVQVVNITSANRSGSPIVARIPKLTGMTAVTLSGTNWTLDAATDPANYVLTYAGTIAPGDAAPAATLAFTYQRATPGTTTFTVNLDNGTGNDNNTANNSDIETLDVNIPPVP